MWLLLLSLLADTTELEIISSEISKTLDILRKNPLFIKLRKLSKITNKQYLANKAFDILKKGSAADVAQINEQISKYHQIKKRMNNPTGSKGFKQGLSSYILDTNISSWVLMAKWKPEVQGQTDANRNIYGTLSWSAKSNPSKTYTTPDVSQDQWEQLTAAGRRGEFGKKLWTLNLLQKGGLNVGFKTKKLKERKSKIGTKYKKLTIKTRKVGHYGK